MTKDGPPQASLGPPHLDEDTLVRLLDGELEGPEVHAARAHLTTCAACLERFRVLEARDRAVRGWLERHDPAPPERWEYTPSAPHRGRAWQWSRPSWAAAAAVLLMALVVVGPARGWIVDRLTPEMPASPAAISGGSSGDPAGAASTSFLPVSSEVTVQLGVPPGPRELDVEATVGERVQFVVLEPGAELLLRRGMLEVRDPALELRRYRLLVPAGVRQVRVRMDAGQDTVVAVSPETPVQRLRLGPG